MVVYATHPPIDPNFKPSRGSTIFVIVFLVISAIIVLGIIGLKIYLVLNSDTKVEKTEEKLK